MTRRVDGPTPLLWMLFSLGLLFLVAPLLIVVPLSFTEARYFRFPPPGYSLIWYETFFTDVQWWGSVITSAKLAAAVAVVATAIGTLAAYGLVRGRPRGRKLIIAWLLSPIIVPAIVSAISLYGLYATIGLIGSFWGLLAAHTIIATPFVVICVVAALQRFDPVYERASLSLGAGPFRTFVRVTLPNVLPGVASGALLAFMHSFDEVVLVLFIGGNILTLPRKLWNEIIFMVEPTQASASVMLILASLCVMTLWLLLQPRDQR